MRPVLPLLAALALLAAGLAADDAIEAATASANPALVAARLDIVTLRQERDRARAYADRLERIVAIQVNRAEREEDRRERQVRRHRRAWLRVWYGAPWGNHPDERKALCVHTYEGAWNSTSNPVYDGGMQMDMDFQRSYGRWALNAYGTADRWPVAVQIAVALEAVHSGRGWRPWPNTARMCGLL